MSTFPATGGLGTTLRSVLTLVIAVAVVMPALAQNTAYPPPPPDQIVRSEFAATNMTADMLSMYNLSGMSDQWWKDLSAYLDEKLAGAGDDQEDAMRMIIFLGTYYPDKANFDRSSTELFNIYRFNENEEYRVMALAALYANGDESAMRLIAYHAPYTRYAPWEDDDLVRHVTEAAIARHFGTPQVIVEAPTVIGRRRN